MSVCLSNSAATGRILIKFDIGIFFEKSLEKTKISLKSDNNNEGCFTWRRLIYDISLNYF